MLDEIAYLELIQLLFHFFVKKKFKSNKVRYFVLKSIFFFFKLLVFDLRGQVGDVIC